tara:strand:- start:219 stop:419 length:201 start_codon:yes stop_codon:yes gene_type:complete
MKITVSKKFTVKQLLTELDYIAKQSEESGYVWFPDYIDRPKTKVLLALGWLVEFVDDDGQRNIYIS